MSDGSQERYFHGTRADLKPEDLIEPGYNSNFGSR
jgi:rifampin ADP-ribosylating transferase